MKNENFRVPEREELPQEEKYDEKTRGPELQKMTEEGERVFRVRDGKSRSRAHSKREKRKLNKAWQRRKWEEGL